MKNSKFLWILLLLPAIFTACQDDDKKEDIKPRQITEYQVKAINGGAFISYTIPNDDNILYVMAEYERNGEIFTERSSIYNNSLTIEGFNTSNTVKAAIYTVNYYETKSDPLPIEFVPLESPISIAFHSLIMKPGFGGIYLEWENPSRTEFGIRLMVEEDGKWNDKEMYFSSLSEGRTFREFDDKLTTFGVALEDRWGNISDTASIALTPIAELEAWPYKHYSPDEIPYDKITANASFRRAMLYDHINGNNAWYAEAGEDNRSSTFTLDLGEPYLLSRTKFWARQFGGAAGTTRLNPYISGRVPLVLEFYGIKEFPREKLGDKGYWLHSFTEKGFTHDGVEISSPNFTDEWIFLGRFTRERLDKLGYTDNEIYKITDAGEEFAFPDDAQPIRYIRVVVIEVDAGTPPPGGIFQIGELNFWGNNKVTP